jgi:hypothetical protein
MSRAAEQQFQPRLFAGRRQIVQENLSAPSRRDTVRTPHKKCRACLADDGTHGLRRIGNADCSRQHRQNAGYEMSAVDHRTSIARGVEAWPNHSIRRHLRNLAAFTRRYRLHDRRTSVRCQDPGPVVPFMNRIDCIVRRLSSRANPI